MASPYRALVAPLARVVVVAVALLVAACLAWGVAVPTWAEAPRLVLYLVLAVVVVYRWAVREMGYAPVTADELGCAELVHYSRLSATELDPAGTGVVDLAPAYCTFWSRMLRRDLFWPRRTVPAVYFFAGEPPLAVRAGQVDAPRARVAVDSALIRGPLFWRRDGCIALPKGYQGAAVVSDVAAVIDDHDRTHPGASATGAGRIQLIVAHTLRLAADVKDNLTRYTDPVTAIEACRRGDVDPLLLARAHDVLAGLPRLAAGPDTPPPGSFADQGANGATPDTGEQ